MAVEYTIVSIGTMESNLLWEEKGKVRNGHLTTTLVTDEDRTILVDPSLPGEILEARFNERTGKTLDSVTDVFCTTLHPSCRRGLPSLVGANWWCSETELVDFNRHLTQLAETVDRLDGADAQYIESERDIIGRFRCTPDKFSSQVGIFPLPGYSPGCAGLLLTPTTHTILITGPAATTQGHINRGMVWENCQDRDMAKESLVEILEIADVIIPGFDNIMFCPQRWM